MIGVKNKIWFLREGLFAKYVIALVGLVVFVLAVNGAIETWISYRATRTTLTDGMSDKAEATAKRIDWHRRQWIERRGDRRARRPARRDLGQSAPAGTGPAPRPEPDSRDAPVADTRGPAPGAGGTRADRRASPG